MGVVKSHKCSRMSQPRSASTTQTEEYVKAHVHADDCMRVTERIRTKYIIIAILLLNNGK